MKSHFDLLKEMTVLYAEDDSIVQDSIVKTLSVFFKTVHAVNNGADALKMYEDRKPNIVILDIRMPLINGLEIASIIRQKNRTTPIIITTSYTENDNFLKAVKLNLVDYLIKPFSFEQLRNSLLEAIERMEQNGLLVQKIEDELYYDHTAKILIQDKQIITLTKNEIIILEELLSHQGKLVSYDSLEEILGMEFADSKASIKNTILRLRKKIGKNAIVNVQDMGYLMP